MRNFMNFGARKWLYAKSFLLLVIIAHGLSFFSGEAYAANPVSVSLTGDAVTIAYGQSVTLSSTVTDTSNSSNSPVGSVTFTDNGIPIQTAQTLIEQTPVIITLASPPGSIPSGYKQACMIDGRDTNPVGSPTCPVLKWGEYTFWGYSDTNNMGYFNIVQYNKEGDIVNQNISQTGARYLYKIELDNTNHTVSFVGQSDQKVTSNLNSLKAANGIASITTPPLSVGVHEFKAEFNSSDGNHNHNESSIFRVNVPKITSSVSLTSSVASSVYGERVSFAAEVPSVSGLVSSGDVIFYDGNVELGTVTLGQSIVNSAVYETASLTPGVHTITARYSGDNNFESLASSSFTYTVNTIAPNLSLTSSSSQVTYGLDVTFTAQVPVVNAVPVTGTVTFNDGATQLGFVTIGTNGTAQWSATGLSVGSHTITASYSGDNHYLASSQSVLLTVVGISGGSSSTPSSDTVTSTVGTLKLPVGKPGQVSFGDAVKISIPANATDKELLLTIEKLTDSINLITKNDVLASPIFEILKNFSENFSKEITMTLTFDPKSLKGDQEPCVFYYDESKQVWVKIGGEVNGNTITVKVNHFTKFAVLGVGQDSDSTSNPKQPTSFSDISGHWAEDNIKQAASAGIVSGYQDGTFKPDRTVTRAEFAVMLMNALKSQGDEVALTFTDKSKIGAWAQKSIMQAVYAGIITGYEDSTFRPNAEITRSEMTAMIAKALAQTLNEKTATGFSDDKYIPDWAKGAVAAMKKLGIVEGKGTNQFAPNDKTTRAEAVTVLLRMLAQKSKNE
ncbi:Ig-like domain repeat protein [Cohnella terricola]|uniref:SLH domain-containing protein n=1 Tax=Cohnella terricola TaxID=1289167 RepID=A0A559JGU6_9BACL|nr:Ig-like domain repeat protein [Cohnella terricola]TVX99096.1 hypothetical protein FPZ45_14205 [Cohnella terricola]